MLEDVAELPMIVGAGGDSKGGSGGGGLAEQSDSLKSTSYAQVLDLVCEGEIGGLVAGLKSIYLDGVPIQNADGTNNFSGVTYATTTGTQSQGVIAGYDETRSEFIVGVEAKVSSGPIARAISSANVTSVVVTVQMPALTNLDGQGNLGGTSVNFAIDVQVNGGGWVEKVNDTITGKSSGPYQRQYRILLPTGATRNVRLRRITADSSSSSLNNKTYFQAYTEIIDAKLSYPNSALVAVKVDASQFRSIPTRGYDMKLLLVRFPTNATVRADGSLAYTGTWDGTFQVGWCADPAWAYYDLITANRYGLGDYLGTNPLSKWDCYTISKYCAELVPDGFGGTEPRFACHVWINGRQEAYKLLSDLTSCFRGMAYWGTGQVALVQDAPKDPSYLFTNANVVDGVFRYEGSSAKARHTVALVTYNDPADLYRQKIEYVEDTAGIARYGVIPTEVVAFGCASRGQAARVGRWLLYSERSETEMVTFRTGGEGAICRPGDVIKVADQHRAGARLGGRVSAASATSITVDALPSVPPAGSTLYVLGADGVVQQRTTGTVTGNAIAVSPNLSPVPPAGAIWVVATAAVDAQTFRVLSVAETDEGEHDVLAVAHNPAKFAAIETGLKIQSRTITSLNPVPSPPGSLAFSQGIVAIQGVPQLRLTVKWQAATGADRYAIEWRASSGNWQAAATRATEFDIDDAQVATYEVRVKALSFAGGQSSALTGSYTITSAALAAAQAAYQASTTAGSIIGQAWAATNGSQAATDNNYVSGFANQAIDSEFTLGATGWNEAYASSGTWVFNFFTALGSKRFLERYCLSPAAGANVNLGQDTFNGVPVADGDRLELSGIVSWSNMSSAQLFVGYFSAAGSYITGATVAGGVFDTRVGGFVTVPSGLGIGIAKLMAIFTVATGGTTASARLAQPFIRRCPAGQTTLSPYNPGPSIQRAADITSQNTAAAVVGQSAWATYASLTPQQVAQLVPNMVYNPTGVLGLDRWTVNSGTINGVKGAYSEGYYFYTSTGSNTVPQAFYQDVPVAAGPAYTISADIFAQGISVSTGSTQARVYIQWINGSGGHISYSATAAINAGTAWTHVSAVGQVAPAGAVTARVWCDVWGTGVYTISAVAWSKVKLQQGSVDTLFTDDATYGARYVSGVSIEALKPAQVGADKTSTNTAAAIAGQGDLATQNRASLAFGDNAIVNSEFTAGSDGLSNWSPPGAPCTGWLNLSGWYGKRNVAFMHYPTAVLASGSWYDFAQKGIWGTSDSAAQKRNGLAVKQGDNLYARALLGVHRCAGQVYILIFDSSGGLIEAPQWTGGRSGGGSNGDPANFDLVGGTYTVTDSRATTAQFMIRMLGNGGGDPYLFFTEPAFGIIPAGQTALPPYIPGRGDPAADVTSQNTAADTSAVGGRAAGDVAGTINPGGGVAANKVTTSSIVGNAVTAIANSFASSPMAVASGPSAPTAILSATITVAAGDYVLVDFVANGQFTSSGAGAGALFETAIYVDGADSGYGWVNQQLPYSNASFFGGYSLASGSIALTGLAAGTHTIALMMKATTVAGTMTWGPYATWRSLTLFKGQR